MADIFQNGLYLTPPASQANGRAWAKWFYMIISECLGLTIKDSSGSVWTNTKATGTAGATVSGYEGRIDITADSYSFVAGDVNRYMTISGFSGSYSDRDSVYRITEIISSKVALVDILRGGHSNGLPYPETGLTWKIWEADTTDCPTAGDWFVYTGTATQGGGFSFDVKVTVGVSGTNTCYMPQFEVGPYGNWNATSHDWDTAQHIDYGFINKDSSIYQLDNSVVLASMSADAIVVLTRTMDDYQNWHLTYIGEIDVKDATVDTKPIVIIQGSNGNDDRDNIIGYGLDSTNTDIFNGARWLAASDSTAQVTGYLAHYCVRPDSEASMVSGAHRHASQLTGRPYAEPIYLECRDWPTNGEVRGRTRNLKMANDGLPRCRRLNPSDSRLHVFGGLTIDWHSSNIHDPRIGS
jgi:hypothetical protein